MATIYDIVHSQVNVRDAKAGVLDIAVKFDGKVKPLRLTVAVELVSLMSAFGAWNGI